MTRTYLVFSDNELNHAELWKVRIVTRFRVMMLALKNSLSFRRRKPLALVIPPEPWTLVGSRGDQAMLRATFQQLSKRYSPFAVVLSHSAACHASKMGYFPVLLKGIPISTRGLIPGREISALIAIGADIIDGSYNDYPLEVIGVLAASVKDGTKCIILGSSFNKKPNPKVVDQLRELDKRVRLYARDAVSQERFTRNGILGTTLSADVAFLLPPKFDCEAYRAAAAWKARIANSGVFVCLNIHYALFGSPEAAAVFATDLAEELIRLSESHRIYWIILPHDYRVNSGDLHLCRILCDALRASVPEYVWTAARNIDCDEAKAIVSLSDAAVTGRMHLAIAALGMKVPALCLDYQDKFEGMLYHFALPSALLIKRENLSVDFLRDSIIGLILDLRAHKRAVTGRHSEVMALSQKNFEW